MYYFMPDPNDCTPNTPLVLVEPTDVLAYFNSNNEASKQRIDSRVRKYFAKAAEEAGWKTAKFTGNQCILDSGVVRAASRDVTE
jgi:hypothetical protein